MLSFLQCQKTPKRIRIRLGKHFSPTGNNKKQSGFVFWKMSYSAKGPKESSMLFSSKNALFSSKS